VHNAPISMIDLLEQIHTKELILLKIDYLWVQLVHIFTSILQNYNNFHDSYKLYNCTFNYNKLLHKEYQGQNAIGPF
jgi:hypothetical protein